MKDPFELLRMNERNILRVNEEIEALRIAAELLGEKPPSTSDGTIEFRKIANFCPSPALMLDDDRWFQREQF
jgi:hypothetical protein